MTPRLTSAVFAGLFCLCSLALAESSTTIDLNRADAATLADALPGIGPVKAAAIVAYRRAQGPFTAVDDLIDVKGIGPRTLEALRDRLHLSDEPLSGRRRDPERAVRAAVRAAIRLAERDAESVASEAAQRMDPYPQILHPLPTAERR